MNKNTKLRDLIKKMIAESVSPRIRAIDEAGDTAANEAKITRLDEELKKASKIAEVLEKVNLEHYIGEKLYSKVIKNVHFYYNTNFVQTVPLKDLLNYSIYEYHDHVAFNRLCINKDYAEHYEKDY